VSSGVEEETLFVTFWGSAKYFKSTEGKPVNIGTMLNRQITRQVPNDKTAQYISASGAILSRILLAIILVVALLMVCMSGSLAYLWSFINTMQILTHAPLMNLRFDGYSAMFIKPLLDIFRFNWLPIEMYLDKFFGFDSLSPSLKSYF